MPEKIKDINILGQSTEDLTGYAIYVARRRALPDPRDGLIPVRRRIMWAMYSDFPQGRTIKTHAVVGKVLEKYHPHGDSSVLGAIRTMTAWFKCYKPLLYGQGNFGNLSGDKGSADRYTENCISDYGRDCVIGDLRFSNSSTDWQETYSGDYQEPVYLPSVVPNLLINGSFSIAVGLRCQIPKHNINEVVNATIKLIDNPNANVVLVPDDTEGCDIVEADFKKISETGKGNFKIRAKVEICEFENHPALKILSLPDGVLLDAIQDRIEKLKEANVLPQVIDVYDANKVDEKDINRSVFEAYIVLKKGSDPNYVKDVLFSSTQLQTTIAVNFEVVFNETPQLLNYKRYLLLFIEFRRERKKRMYAAKLSECNTKMHKMKLYLEVMKQPKKLDMIISKIRKEKSLDMEKYINLIVESYKKKSGEVTITPLQAEFLLNTNLQKLSIGYKDKYQQIYDQANAEAISYYNILTNNKLIDEAIKQELRDVLKKYGEPRRSKVISASEASGVPEGEFKIVITEKGFIKKIDKNDKVGYMKDDRASIVMTVDNTDDLIFFGKLGKAYKIPVAKIPFSQKASNGYDLRVILKKYTGEGICTVISDKTLHAIEDSFKSTKQECNLFIMTRDGLFKRMKLSEMFNVPLSGLIYSKLNEGDVITDIICMDPYNQLVIYSRNKILRIQGIEAPLVTRNTKGYIAMNSKHPIDGMACLYPDASDLIVVTNSGKINKVPLSVIPVGGRAKSGNSIIKLGKNDGIRKILVSSPKDILIATTMKQKYEIPVKDIKSGSSIGSGDKMLDSSGILDVGIIHG